MRLRSLSILATSTFFALLGCPLDEMSASSDADPGAESDSSGDIADNTASHDDRVDAASDVAWAQGEVGTGRSALRVLMTDAPLDADKVFVTICGIHVHALGPALPGTSPDGRDPRGTAGAGAGGGASAPRPGDEGRAGAGGAGSGSPGAGGAGAGGDGGEPLPEAPEDKDDAAQAAAAAGAGGVPGDSAEADAAEADAAEADAAGSDDEDVEVDDTDRGDAVPVDGRDPAQAPPSDVEGGEPREGGPGGEWLPVSEQCQTMDLLTLQNGVTEAVGVAALPPGRYGQIRLLIADASVVVQGVEQALVIPSGSESGLKINGGFELFDGEATTITLDFDAGRSVHYEPGTGYMMTPVIELIDVSEHAAAPGAGGDRGGVNPGVDGAGGRPGSGGAGGAESQPGEGRPRPEMPGVDPANPDAPKPGDQPMPPPPGAPDGAGGYAGAGGGSGDGGGAVPPEKDDAESAE
jgi:hypothetical protein